MWKVDAVVMNTIKGVCLLKKKYNLLFILFISGLLFACNTEEIKKTDDSEVRTTFSGTIVEILTNNTAIVSSEYGRVLVDLSVNSAVTFQVGDEIEVGYDGVILESDPAQIKTLSVELVE